MIRVAILAEVRLYRDGLAEALATDSRFDVVAAAPGGADAVDAVSRVAADVTVLDLTIDNAAYVIQALKRAAPSLRVVALGVSESETDVIPLAEAGVAGYVACGETLEDLVETVESVARGESRCSPRIVPLLLRRVAEFAAGRPEASICTVLTAREREILELIDEGLSNKEIARRLYIELATVKNHVHNIMGKLGVERRDEAAALLAGPKGLGQRTRPAPAARSRWLDPRHRSSRAQNIGRVEPKS